MSTKQEKGFFNFFCKKTKKLTLINVFFISVAVASMLFEQHYFHVNCVRHSPFALTGGHFSQTNQTLLGSFAPAFLSAIGVFVVSLMMCFRKMNKAYGLYILGLFFLSLYASMSALAVPSVAAHETQFFIYINLGLFAFLLAILDLIVVVVNTDHNS